MGCCQSQKAVVSPYTKQPGKSILSADHKDNEQSGVSEAQRIFNNRSFALSKQVMKAENEEFWILSR